MRGSVGEYVSLGFFGAVTVLFALIALPVVLPCYLIGRFIVTPLMDWLAESK